LPGFTTIIDQLMRTASSGSDTVSDQVEHILQLLPQSEAATDAESTAAARSRLTSAWASGLAFESLRGWHWPYWINLQTNPATGIAAYPSAAPFTSGLPLLQNKSARDAAPILLEQDSRFAGTMDRRAMITPPDSRFSIETWFRIGDELIIPSDISTEQSIHFANEPSAGQQWKFRTNQSTASVSATATLLEDTAFLKIAMDCKAPSSPVIIYASIRPYHLDSIAPVHDLVYNSKGFWMSDSQVVALFTRRPDLAWASDARHGDAALFLTAPPERTAVRCAAGMATAISAFHFQPGENAHVELYLPFAPVYPRELPLADFAGRDTPPARRRQIRQPASSALNHPTVSQRTSSPASPLENASLIHLLAATDTANPTMQQMLVARNNWIVPAVRALVRAGHSVQAARLLGFCMLGIQRNGYLSAARGRWAFHGQMLTALADYFRLQERPPDETLATWARMRSAAKWIMRKRREVAHAPQKPAGLLPPGIGPQGQGPDYFLADNFWAIEGLCAASWLGRQFGEHAEAETFYEEAAKMSKAVQSAVHRELEFGITQQVPGRLRRSFDAAAGAELLDLALLDEAAGMLDPLDWFASLLKALSQPLRADSTDNSPHMLALDQRGIRPARRILLELAKLNAYRGKTGPEFWPDLQPTQDLAALATPQNTWSESISLPARTGLGQLHFDPEAAALYLILQRKLKEQANNRAV